MTNSTAVPKATDFERVERNQLFAEFEQQALRVTREYANEPYGDLPGTRDDYFAAYLDGRLAMKQRPGKEAAKAKAMFDSYAQRQRPKGVGSFTLRMFTFSNKLGYATLYEQREKGTGFYWRLRTVKEAYDKPEPTLVISDYAIKSTAPNRSINWLIATRSANDGFLFDREDGPGTDQSKEWSYRTWAGTDLMPGNFQPRTAEDYERVKLRLLEATTILGKMGSANAISELSYIPTPIAPYLANPVVYSLTSPRL